jgi:hypothetical protein
VKKEFLLDNKGKPSLMRYIVLFSARFGAMIAALSFLGLVISLFKDSPEFAQYFTLICLSGLAEVGVGITGKAIQKKHENYSE